MTTDKIQDLLQGLNGSLPEPRLNLTESQKDEIIKNVGKKTVMNLIKAKKQLPLARIPFLFSSIDTQIVVDVLANDFAAALKRVSIKF